MNTKLLTLNLHCLLAGEEETLLDGIAEHIMRGGYDAVALQEVCQTPSAAAVCPGKAAGFLPAEAGETLRADNQALRLARRLVRLGFTGSWTWSCAHIGYGRFEEGTAVFTRRTAAAARAVYTGPCTDPADWHTRRQNALCIEDENGKTWFYSCHFGAWTGKDSGFAVQWEMLERALAGTAGDVVYLMGDFNCPARTKGGGYELVNSGKNWYDGCETHPLNTIPGAIDGWKQKQAACQIDYIWKNRPFTQAVSHTVFDGTALPMVSDHYGLEVIEVK